MNGNISRRLLLRIAPAFLSFLILVVVACAPQRGFAQSKAGKHDNVKTALAGVAAMKVGKHDWPQWGGWSGRNNTPAGKNIPHEWDIDTGRNIKWSAKLGSTTYGNPAVANGKIFIGTNNGGGYLKRYPADVDLGCLLCFDEQTGKFLWQHSNAKLSTGDRHDYALQGVCCTPFVDGDRLWYVSNRGEVVCLDTEGFLDGSNDGPFTNEPRKNKNEADVVWTFDMMRKLGSSQHNMASCSVTCAGEILLVCTSNGVDDSETDIPKPDAPSFFAMNRTTSKVLWTDKSPGAEILHGQWSSPAYAVLGKQPQALFAGGDGWLYSFDPNGNGNGGSKLLWKFDCNPKHSVWRSSGRGTRNNIIAAPVVYDGLVYCAAGQDPEHGEGMGHLWCIDPTKRGDVSPTLAVDAKRKPLPKRRFQAVDPDAGEKAVPNPRSALVWHYGAATLAEYRKQDFEQQLHRTLGTVAIKDDLLYLADMSGLVHCLHAKKTGAKKQPVVYWTHDMFGSAWGSPLIVDGKVYIGDTDGEITVFEHAAKLKILSEVSVTSAVYGTPIVANNVLYIANTSRLFAISAKGK